MPTFISFTSCSSSRQLHTQPLWESPTPQTFTNFSSIFSLTLSGHQCCGCFASLRAAPQFGMLFGRPLCLIVRSCWTEIRRRELRGRRSIGRSSVMQRLRSGTRHSIAALQSLQQSCSLGRFSYRF
jgi:hypothetical protein